MLGSSAGLIPWPALTWNVLMLVLLQVPVKIGLLAKAPVAQVAFEWLLLVVDVPNMALEIGGNAERPVTIFTPAKPTEGCRINNKPLATMNCS